MENERLYIPVGVKVQEEIFPGINKKDLLYLIITAFYLNLINLFLYFILGAGALQMIAALFIFVISYFVWNKDVSNVSIANYIGWMIRAVRSVKQYHYRYKEECEDERID